MKHVELFHHASDHPAADLLDCSYAMIGINHLVTDVEVDIHLVTFGQDVGRGNDNCENYTALGPFGQRFPQLWRPSPGYNPSLLCPP
jgi:hypothetical protein